MLGVWVGQDVGAEVVRGGDFYTLLMMMM